MPRAVGVEESDCVVQRRSLARDDAEAAAARDVQQREVESEHEQERAIDDHELAVIADEILSGPIHSGARAEQPLLQLPQVAGAAVISVRDQRVHVHSALDGRVQRVRDVVD